MTSSLRHSDAISVETLDFYEIMPVKFEKLRDVSHFKKRKINDTNCKENFLLTQTMVFYRFWVVLSVFFQSKFNVQTSRYLLNYNIIILLKSLASNSTSITKSVSVLLSTFSNAHRQERALNFDILQSTWLPSWISKRMLCNIYDVTDHVQN